MLSSSGGGSRNEVVGDEEARSRATMPGLPSITNTVTMLVASEVDSESACRLIEWMSHHDPGGSVDVCLVGGPLAPTVGLEPDSLNPTKEQELAAGKYPFCPIITIMVCIQIARTWKISFAS